MGNIPVDIYPSQSFHVLLLLKCTLVVVIE